MLSQQHPHHLATPGAAHSATGLTGQWKATLSSTHLSIEGSQSQAANGGKEQRGHSNLDEEGGHHTELVQPDWQVVGKPGSRGGQALCLIVVGESCR